MFSSIQLSSISSCSGVKPAAPSTPKPPALLTATTTSRQWLKASRGNSTPNISVTGVFIELLPSGLVPDGTGRYQRVGEREDPVGQRLERYWSVVADAHWRQPG